MDMAEYWTTSDSDPRAVYHDVLIALDEARGINNGQPSLWAFLLDHLDVLAGERVLHLGCGTGYYTAFVAELVGLTGRITAIEIDPGLAEKARVALMPWPQITVSNADGASLAFEQADLIVVSAGATHPLLSWLDALKPGGRLMARVAIRPPVWNSPRRPWISPINGAGWTYTAANRAAATDVRFTRPID